MKFIHYQVVAGPEDIIQIKLDSRANVRFFDTVNFQKYKINKEYDFIGGIYDKKMPAEFHPPKEMLWHIVIDLEGQKTDVKSTMNVLKI